MMTWILIVQTFVLASLLHIHATVIQIKNNQQNNFVAYWKIKTKEKGDE